MAISERDSSRETNGEIGMVGFAFGGVLGGMVVGSAADFLNAPGNTLAYYVAGCVLGAIAGLVAAFAFKKLA